MRKQSFFMSIFDDTCVLEAKRRLLSCADASSFGAVRLLDAEKFRE